MYDDEDVLTLYKYMLTFPAKSESVHTLHDSVAYQKSPALQRHFIKDVTKCMAVLRDPSLETAHELLSTSSCNGNEVMSLGKVS